MSVKVNKNGLPALNHGRMGYQHSIMLEWATSTQSWWNGVPALDHGAMGYQHSIMVEWATSTQSWWNGGTSTQSWWNGGTSTRSWWNGLPALNHGGMGYHHSIMMEWGTSTRSWWGYQLTKIVQNGGPQAISEILHIEYRIVCSIETYIIYIYHLSKCRKCNWNRYIEGFCMWNVHFQINVISPNIAYVILINRPLIAINFLLMYYWLFMCSFHIMFNNNK